MNTVKQDGTIVLPRGDTLSLTLRLGGKSWPSGTAAVFGICSKLDGRRMLAKTYPVQGNVIAVKLLSGDTARIAPGEYYWDLRQITRPQYRDNGEAVCGGQGSTVTSLFSGTGMPDCIITEVAADV